MSDIPTLEGRGRCISGWKRMKIKTHNAGNLDAFALHTIIHTEPSTHLILSSFAIILSDLKGFRKWISIFLLLFSLLFLFFLSSLLCRYVASRLRQQTKQKNDNNANLLLLLFLYSSLNVLPVIQPSSKFFFFIVYIHPSLIVRCAII